MRFAVMKRISEKLYPDEEYFFKKKTARKNG